MNIAIAGYGVEGQANYRYWKEAHPDANITIVDEHPIEPSLLPEGAMTIIGQDAFLHLSEFDLVIRTAGLAPRKIVTHGKIWSGTNEFFARCPAPIIGVTGSKGKGTTASLIASMLKADGHTVWLVGNIGQPALELLQDISPDDIVIYELSSFQLWDIERSPQTAVVLYIEQDHLDVHVDMDEYVAAKANIARFQTGNDRLIYWSDNQYVRHIAGLSAAQKTPVPDEAAAHIVDDAFWYADTQLCSLDQLAIKGAHNHANALAAIDAVWPFIRQPAAIAEGLAAFHGLPHRLRFVATVHDVDYYDDSIATTPTAAIAALRAFPEDQPKVIILGGSSKGSDFTLLAKEMTRHDVDAILIGEEATRLEEAFRAADFHRFQTIVDASMTEIVTHAHARAVPGAVVLLSPAAASFGLFKNYSDRGDQFVAAVRTLPV